MNEIQFCAFDSPTSVVGSIEGGVLSKKCIGLQVMGDDGLWIGTDYVSAGKPHRIAIMDPPYLPYDDPHYTISALQERVEQQRKVIKYYGLLALLWIALQIFQLIRVLIK